VCGWLTAAAHFHGAALTCLTRRRCRTALFALESDRHLGPLVPLCCCSAERSQPAAYRAQLYHKLRSGKRGGCQTCLQRQAAFFCCTLLCSLSCGAQGKLRCSARLRAVCLLLLHSALDVVARCAALKYAAPCCSRKRVASVPALRSRTGRNGGATVVGRRGSPRVLRWVSAPGR